RSHPFYYNRYRLYRNDWVSHVGNIPFLKEHVSIVPHERVTTHKHYYSYSVTGCDIGWHSPEVISERPSRLSDILKKEFYTCITENKLFKLEELSRMLKNNYDQLGNQPHDEPLERLQGWARE